MSETYDFVRVPKEMAIHMIDIIYMQSSNGMDIFIHYIINTHTIIIGQPLVLGPTQPLECSYIST